jgi:hypothetical protein
MTNRPQIKNKSDINKFVNDYCKDPQNIYLLDRDGNKYYLIRVRPKEERINLLVSKQGKIIKCFKLNINNLLFPINKYEFNRIIWDYKESILM